MSLHSQIVDAVNFGVNRGQFVCRRVQCREPTPWRDARPDNRA